MLLEVPSKASLNKSGSIGSSPSTSSILKAQSPTLPPLQVDLFGNATTGERHLRLRGYPPPSAEDVRVVLRYILPNPPPEWFTPLIADKESRHLCELIEATWVLDPTSPPYLIAPLPSWSSATLPTVVEAAVPGVTPIQWQRCEGDLTISTSISMESIEPRCVPSCGGTTCVVKLAGGHAPLSEQEQSALHLRVRISAILKSREVVSHERIVRQPQYDPAAGTVTFRFPPAPAAHQRARATVSLSVDGGRQWGADRVTVHLYPKDQAWAPDHLMGQPAIPLRLAIRLADFTLQNQLRTFVGPVRLSPISQHHHGGSHPDHGRHLDGGSALGTEGQTATLGLSLNGHDQLARQWQFTYTAINMEVVEDPEGQTTPAAAPAAAAGGRKPRCLRIQGPGIQPAKPAPEAILVRYTAPVGMAGDGASETVEEVTYQTPSTGDSFAHGCSDIRAVSSTSLLEARFAPGVTPPALLCPLPPWGSSLLPTRVSLALDGTHFRPLPGGGLLFPEIPCLTRLEPRTLAPLPVLPSGQLFMVKAALLSGAPVPATAKIVLQLRISPTPSGAQSQQQPPLGRVCRDPPFDPRTGIVTFSPPPLPPQYVSARATVRVSVDGGMQFGMEHVGLRYYPEKLLWAPERLAGPPNTPTQLALYLGDHTQHLLLSRYATPALRFQLLLPNQPLPPAVLLPARLSADRQCWMVDLPPGPEDARAHMQLSLNGAQFLDQTWSYAYCRVLARVVPHESLPWRQQVLITGLPDLLGSAQPPDPAVPVPVRYTAPALWPLHQARLPARLTASGGGSQHHTPPTTPATARSPGPAGRITPRGDIPAVESDGGGSEEEGAERVLVQVVLGRWTRDGLVCDPPPWGSFKTPVKVEVCLTPADPSPRYVQVAGDGLLFRHVPTLVRLTPRCGPLTEPLRACAQVVCAVPMAACPAPQILLRVTTGFTNGHEDCALSRLLSCPPASDRATATARSLLPFDIPPYPASDLPFACANIGVSLDGGAQFSLDRLPFVWYPPTLEWYLDRYVGPSAGKNKLFLGLTDRTIQLLLSHLGVTASLQFGPSPTPSPSPFPLDAQPATGSAWGGWTVEIPPGQDGQLVPVSASLNHQHALVGLREYRYSDAPASAGWTPGEVRVEVVQLGASGERQVRFVGRSLASLLPTLQPSLQPHTGAVLTATLPAHASARFPTRVELSLDGTPGYVGVGGDGLVLGHMPCPVRVEPRLVAREGGTRIRVGLDRIEAIGAGAKDLQADIRVSRLTPARPPESPASECAIFQHTVSCEAFDPIRGEATFLVPALPDDAAAEAADPDGFVVASLALSIDGVLTHTHSQIPCPGKLWGLDRATFLYFPSSLPWRHDRDVVGLLAPTPICLQLASSRAQRLLAEWGSGGAAAWVRVMAEDGSGGVGWRMTLPPQTAPRVLRLAVSLNGQQWLGHMGEIRAVTEMSGRLVGITPGMVPAGGCRPRVTVAVAGAMETWDRLVIGGGSEGTEEQMVVPATEFEVDPTLGQIHFSLPPVPAALLPHLPASLPLFLHPAGESPRPPLTGAQLVVYPAPAPLALAPSCGPIPESLAGVPCPTPETEVVLTGLRLGRPVPGCPVYLWWRQTPDEAPPSCPQDPRVLIHREIHARDTSVSLHVGPVPTPTHARQLVECAVSFNAQDWSPAVPFRYFAYRETFGRVPAPPPPLVHTGAGPEYRLRMPFDAASCVDPDCMALSLGDPAGPNATRAARVRLLAGETRVIWMQFGEPVRMSSEAATVWMCPDGQHWLDTKIPARVVEESDPMASLDARPQTADDETTAKAAAADLLDGEEGCGAAQQQQPSGETSTALEDEPVPIITSVTPEANPLPNPGPVSITLHGDHFTPDLQCRLRITGTSGCAHPDLVLPCIDSTPTSTRVVIPPVQLPVQGTWRPCLVDSATVCLFNTRVCSSPAPLPIRGRIDCVPGTVHPARIQVRPTGEVPISCQVTFQGQPPATLDSPLRLRCAPVGGRAFDIADARLCVDEAGITRVVATMSMAAVRGGPAAAEGDEWLTADRPLGEMALTVEQSPAVPSSSTSTSTSSPPAAEQQTPTNPGRPAILSLCLPAAVTRISPRSCPLSSPATIRLYGRSGGFPSDGVTVRLGPNTIVPARTLAPDCLEFSLVARDRTPAPTKIFPIAVSLTGRPEDLVPCPDEIGLELRPDPTLLGLEPWTLPLVAGRGLPLVLRGADFPFPAAVPGAATVQVSLDALPEITTPLDLVAARVLSPSEVQTELWLPPRFLRAVGPERDGVTVFVSLLVDGVASQTRLPLFLRAAPSDLTVPVATYLIGDPTLPLSGKHLFRGIGTTLAISASGHEVTLTLPGAPRPPELDAIDGHYREELATAGPLSVAELEAVQVQWHSEVHPAALRACLADTLVFPVAGAVTDWYVGPVRASLSQEPLGLADPVPVAEFTVRRKEMAPGETRSVVPAIVMAERECAVTLRGEFHAFYETLHPAPGSPPPPPVSLELTWIGAGEGQVHPMASTPCDVPDPETLTFVCPACPAPLATSVPMRVVLKVDDYRYTLVSEAPACPVSLWALAGTKVKLVNEQPIGVLVDQPPTRVRIPLTACSALRPLRGRVPLQLVLTAQRGSAAGSNTTTSSASPPPAPLTIPSDLLTLDEGGISWDPARFPLRPGCYLVECTVGVEGAGQLPGQAVILAAESPALGALTPSLCCITAETPTTLWLEGRHLGDLVRSVAAAGSPRPVLLLTSPHTPPDRPPIEVPVAVEQDTHLTWQLPTLPADFVHFDRISQAPVPLVMSLRAGPFQFGVATPLLLHPRPSLQHKELHLPAVRGVDWTWGATNLPSLPAYQVFLNGIAAPPGAFLCVRTSPDTLHVTLDNPAALTPNTTVRIGIGFSANCLVEEGTLCVVPGCAIEEVTPVAIPLLEDTPIRVRVAGWVPPREGSAAPVKVRISQEDFTPWRVVAQFLCCFVPNTSIFCLETHGVLAFCPCPVSPRPILFPDGPALRPFFSPMLISLSSVSCVHSPCSIPLYGPPPIFSLMLISLFLFPDGTALAPSSRPSLTPLGDSACLLHCALPAIPSQLVTGPLTPVTVRVSFHSGGVHPIVAPSPVLCYVMPGAATGCQPPVVTTVGGAEIQLTGDFTSIHALLHSPLPALPALRACLVRGSDAIECPSLSLPDEHTMKVLMPAVEGLAGPTKVGLTVQIDTNEPHLLLVPSAPHAPLCVPSHIVCLRAGQPRYVLCCEAPPRALSLPLQGLAELTPYFECLAPRLVLTPMLASATEVTTTEEEISLDEAGLVWKPTANRCAPGQYLLRVVLGQGAPALEGCLDVVWVPQPSFGSIEPLLCCIRGVPEGRPPQTVCLDCTGLGVLKEAGPLSVQLVRPGEIRYSKSLPVHAVPEGSDDPTRVVFTLPALEDAVMKGTAPEEIVALQVTLCVDAFPSPLQFPTRRVLSVHRPPRLTPVDARHTPATDLVIKVYGDFLPNSPTPFLACLVGVPRPAGDLFCRRVSPTELALTLPPAAVEGAPVGITLPISVSISPNCTLSGGTLSLVGTFFINSVRPMLVPIVGSPSLRLAITTQNPLPANSEVTVRYRMNDNLVLPASTPRIEPGQTPNHFTLVVPGPSVLTDSMVEAQVSVSFSTGGQHPKVTPHPVWFFNAPSPATAIKPAVIPSTGGTVLQLRGNFGALRSALERARDHQPKVAGFLCVVGTRDRIPCPLEFLDDRTVILSCPSPIPLPADAPAAVQLTAEMEVGEDGAVFPLIRERELPALWCYIPEMIMPRLAASPEPAAAAATATTTTAFPGLTLCGDMLPAVVTIPLAGAKLLTPLKSLLHPSLVLRSSDTPQTLIPEAQLTLFGEGIEWRPVPNARLAPGTYTVEMTLLSGLPPLPGSLSLLVIARPSIASLTPNWLACCGSAGPNQPQILVKGPHLAALAAAGPVQVVFAKESYSAAAPARPAPNGEGLLTSLPASCTEQALLLQGAIPVSLALTVRVGNFAFPAPPDVELLLHKCPAIEPQSLFLAPSSGMSWFLVCRDVPEPPQGLEAHVEGQPGLELRCTRHSSSQIQLTIPNPHVWPPGVEHRLTVSTASNCTLFAGTISLLAPIRYLKVEPALLPSTAGGRVTLTFAGSVPTGCPVLMQFVLPGEDEPLNALAPVRLVTVSPDQFQVVGTLVPLVMYHPHLAVIPRVSFATPGSQQFLDSPTPVVVFKPSQKCEVIAPNLVPSTGGTQVVIRGDFSGLHETLGLLTDPRPTINVTLRLLSTIDAASGPPARIPCECDLIDAHTLFVTVPPLPDGVGATPVGVAIECECDGFRSILADGTSPARMWVYAPDQVHLKNAIVSPPGATQPYGMALCVDMLPPVVPFPVTNLGGFLPLDVLAPSVVFTPMEGTPGEPVVIAERNELQPMAEGLEWRPTTMIKASKSASRLGPGYYTVTVRLCPDGPSLVGSIEALLIAKPFFVRVDPPLCSAAPMGGQEGDSPVVVGVLGTALRELIKAGPPLAVLSDGELSVEVPAKYEPSVSVGGERLVFELPSQCTERGLRLISESPSNAHLTVRAGPFRFHTGLDLLIHKRSIIQRETFHYWAVPNLKFTLQGQYFPAVPPKAAPTLYYRSWFDNAPEVPVTCTRQSSTTLEVTIPDPTGLPRDTELPLSITISPGCVLAAGTVYLLGPAKIDSVTPTVVPLIWAAKDSVPSVTLAVHGSMPPPGCPIDVRYRLADGKFLPPASLPSLTAINSTEGTIQCPLPTPSSFPSTETLIPVTPALSFVTGASQTICSSHPIYLFRSPAGTAQSAQPALMPCGGGGAGEDVLDDIRVTADVAALYGALVSAHPPPPVTVRLRLLDVDTFVPVGAAVTCPAVISDPRTVRFVWPRRAFAVHGPLPVPVEAVLEVADHRFSLLPVREKPTPLDLWCFSRTAIFVEPTGPQGTPDRPVPLCLGRMPAKLTIPLHGMPALAALKTRLRPSLRLVPQDPDGQEVLMEERSVATNAEGLEWTPNPPQVAQMRPGRHRVLASLGVGMGLLQGAVEVVLLGDPRFTSIAPSHCCVIPPDPTAELHGTALVHPQTVRLAGVGLAPLWQAGAVHVELRQGERTLAGPLPVSLVENEPGAPETLEFQAPSLLEADLGLTPDRPMRPVRPWVVAGPFAFDTKADLVFYRRPAIPKPQEFRYAPVPDLVLSVEAHDLPQLEGSEGYQAGFEGVPGASLTCTRSSPTHLDVTLTNANSVPPGIAHPLYVHIAPNCSLYAGTMLLFGSMFIESLDPPAIPNTGGCPLAIRLAGPVPPQGCPLSVRFSLAGGLVLDPITPPTIEADLKAGDHFVVRCQTPRVMDRVAALAAVDVSFATGGVDPLRAPLPLLFYKPPTAATSLSTSLVPVPVPADLPPYEISVRADFSGIWHLQRDTSLIQPTLEVVLRVTTFNRAQLRIPCTNTVLRDARTLSFTLPENLGTSGTLADTLALQAMSLYVDLEVAGMPFTLAPNERPIAETPSTASHPPQLWSYPAGAMTLGIPSPPTDAPVTMLQHSPTMLYLCLGALPPVVRFPLSQAHLLSPLLAQRLLRPTLTLTSDVDGAQLVVPPSRLTLLPEGLEWRGLTACPLVPGRYHATLRIGEGLPPLAGDCPVLVIALPQWKRLDPLLLCAGESTEVGAEVQLVGENLDALVEVGPVTILLRGVGPASRFVADLPASLHGNALIFDMPPCAPEDLGIASDQPAQVRITAQAGVWNFDTQLTLFLHRQPEIAMETFCFPVPLPAHGASFQIRGKYFPGKEADTPSYTAYLVGTPVGSVPLQCRRISGTQVQVTVRDARQLELNRMYALRINYSPNCTLDSALFSLSDVPVVTALQPPAVPLDVPLDQRQLTLVLRAAGTQPQVQPTISLVLPDGVTAYVPTDIQSGPAEAWVDLNAPEDEPPANNLVQWTLHCLLPPDLLSALSENVTQIGVVVRYAQVQVLCAAKLSLFRPPYLTDIDPPYCLRAGDTPVALLGDFSGLQTLLQTIPGYTLQMLLKPLEANSSSSGPVLCPLAIPEARQMVFHCPAMPHGGYVSMGLRLNGNPLALPLHVGEESGEATLFVIDAALATCAPDYLETAGPHTITLECAGGPDAEAGRALYRSLAQLGDVPAGVDLGGPEIRVQLTPARTKSQERPSPPVLLPAVLKENGQFVFVATFSLVTTYTIRISLSAGRDFLPGVATLVYYRPPAFDIGPVCTPDWVALDQPTEITLHGQYLDDIKQILLRPHSRASPDEDEMILDLTAMHPDNVTFQVRMRPPNPDSERAFVQYLLAEVWVLIGEAKHPFPTHAKLRCLQPPTFSNLSVRFGLVCGGTRVALASAMEINPDAEPDPPLDAPVMPMPSPRGNGTYSAMGESPSSTVSMATSSPMRPQSGRIRITSSPQPPGSARRAHSAAPAIEAMRATSQPPIQVGLTFRQLAQTVLALNPICRRNSILFTMPPVPSQCEVDLAVAFASFPIIQTGLTFVYTELPLIRSISPLVCVNSIATPVVIEGTFPMWVLILRNLGELLQRDLESAGGTNSNSNLLPALPGITTPRRPSAARRTTARADSWAQLKSLVTVPLERLLDLGADVDFTGQGALAVRFEGIGTNWIGYATQVSFDRNTPDRRIVATFPRCPRDVQEVRVAISIDRGSVWSPPGVAPLALPPPNIRVVDPPVILAIRRNPKDPEQFVLQGQNFFKPEHSDAPPKVRFTVTTLRAGHAEAKAWVSNAHWVMRKATPTSLVANMASTTEILCRAHSQLTALMESMQNPGKATITLRVYLHEFAFSEPFGVTWKQVTPHPTG
ncbi:hypothetical protein PAPYR_6057 [Paratrimastix pyriformis]|uniref:C2 domain-containing protein n=1 Tax=Paratrimastix pyriformis TaxID=342808 RepID=A0ABQ8UJ39_9EUKA|nr:hypothetical protein PAPYR_6057 [Paratrimastix pyriformis]